MLQTTWMGESTLQFVRSTGLYVVGVNRAIVDNRLLRGLTDPRASQLEPRFGRAGLRLGNTAKWLRLGSDTDRN